MLDNLKNLRKKKRLSQKALSEILGVGQSAVAMWETGQSLPRTELLPRLAEVLGCTVDELLVKEKAPSDTEQEGGV